MKYLYLFLMIPLIMVAESRDAISRKISKMTFQEYKAYMKTDEFKAYQANRKAHPRPSGDALTGQRVILLTRPGCPYCTQAKNLLDSKGIRYSEYNTRSGYGAALFRQYKGTGVPMLIVGKKVLRGYNKEEILSMVGL